MSSERKIWGVWTATILERSGSGVAGSVERSVSTTGTTGSRARQPSSSIRSSIRRTSSGLTSGRTPSWMATMAPSGTLRRAFCTEWKRVRPPATRVCGQWKEWTAQRSFQVWKWARGRTVRTLRSGSASRKHSMVRWRMGRPSSVRNCLGTSPPIRVPLPPATKIP